nr:winged helix-turn-helix domain-containing protein [Protofrankia symbiont of Coriaria ruscifolia]
MAAVGGRVARRYEYATGGGLTAAEQEKREQVRMAAADRFAQGWAQVEVAEEFRVTRKTASRWYHAWELGGMAALRSRGPASRCRLGPVDIARLEAILRRGPRARGWEDQRWTLARVRQVIARTFGQMYTLAGVWTLLDRYGWSCQLPAARPPVGRVNATTVRLRCGRRRCGRR